MTGTASIAVVDNDALVRDALDNVVRASGYRSIAFPSIAALVSARPDAPFDLVLASDQTPDSDGVHMLRSIREIGLHTPIIVMTSAIDDATAKTKARGAAAVLHKPFEADALMALIECALSASSHAAPHGLSSGLPPTRPAQAQAR